jgi:pyrimidine-specific ribonucleoside hydrolase
MTADTASLSTGMTPVTRRPVILDVDTGFDDALALLMALRAPQLEVLAVTCVAGNHRLDQVVANTLKVLDAAGAGEIPVAAGMDLAL